MDEKHERNPVLRIDAKLLSYGMVDVTKDTQGRGIQSLEGEIYEILAEAYFHLLILSKDYFMRGTVMLSRPRGP